MLRRTFTIVLSLFLFAGLSFAQSKVATQTAKKINADSKNEISNFVDTERTLNKVAAEQLLLTEYDYAGNNSIPNMLEMYDFTEDGELDVVAVAMQRFDAVAASRVVKMIVGNSTEGFTDFEVSNAGGSGWGEVRVASEGPLAGNALVTFHAGGNSNLTKVDLATFSPTFPAGASYAGNFPSFVYLPDGTIYGTNTLGELFVSTDQGATFTSTGNFLDPSDPAPTAFNSEYLLKSSPNGQYIFHPSAWAYAGEGGPGGTPDDSTDFTGINYSTDGGATWQFEIIGREGVTPVANRTGYFPLFENFGQINGAVDNNGVMHVTINGYGYWTSTDTTFAFPALYWNSRDRDWLAVSDETVEQGIILDTDTYTYPGNGIGNAYPTPVLTPDGNNVVVMWQGPEYAGVPGGSAVNTFTPTATDPVEIYYTDIYYAMSNDGGVTWSAPAVVPDASSQMVQESYPSPYTWLDVDGTTGTVHFLFMIDDIPGTSLFADNNTGNNNSSWNYSSFDVSVVTDVEDEFNLVNNFELAQNYPNPFNPTTNIKYSVAERSNVTLKVFDMLGREVATLLNSVKEAGSYEVNFDASDLASGLYVYSITAGNFTSSKKMMLMK